MELGYLLLASLAIMLVSLSGMIFVVKRLSKWAKKNIRYMMAFASGVFLIVAYDLIFESLEVADSPSVVITSIIVGFLFFFLLEKFYPEVHCHHGDESCLTDNNKTSARKVLIGDALHNAADGILLAPVFVVDIRLGFIAAFGILVHEFVQEIAEFFVLKTAGYTDKEALLRNFIVSSTIVLGALGGFYLSSFEQLVSPLIGLAAGAFIYILIIDLIPDSVRHSHSERRYLQYAAWALLGILLIAAINLLAHTEATTYTSSSYQDTPSSQSF